MTGEVATALSALALAGFGFAGYSYRRYDTIAADSREWLAEYFRLQASRQAAALEDVLRFTLPELVESYFDTTPDENPMPLTAEDLRSLAADMAAEPDAAPYLQRRRLTEPVARRVAAGIREQLDNLTPGVVRTEPVQAGLTELRVVMVDSLAIQHRVRSLAKAYLFQTALGAALGFALLSLVFGVPGAEVLTPILLALCLVSAIGLEIVRDLIRESLRLEATAAELARE